MVANGRERFLFPKMHLAGGIVSLRNSKEFQNLLYALKLFYRKFNRYQAHETLELPKVRKLERKLLQQILRHFETR